MAINTPSLLRTVNSDEIEYLVNETPFLDAALRSARMYSFFYKIVNDNSVGPFLGPVKTSVEQVCDGLRLASTQRAGTSRAINGCLVV